MGRHRRRYEQSNQNITIKSSASVKVEGHSETSKGNLHYSSSYY